MGDVGDIHSHCLILGEILLGTLDRIHGELIQDGGLHGTYQQVTPETGRRQVVEHLITLYYKHRIIKKSTRKKDKAGCLTKIKKEQEKDDEAAEEDHSTSFNEESDSIENRHSNLKDNVYDSILKNNIRLDNSSMTGEVPDQVRNDTDEGLDTSYDTDLYMDENEDDDDDIDEDISDKEDTDYSPVKSKKRLTTKQRSESKELQQEDVVDVMAMKKEYLCTWCDQSYSTKHGLREHQANKHGENARYMCTCGKYFYDKRNYVNHQDSHAGIKRFTCTLCNKSFSSKTNLNAHCRSACDSPSKQKFRPRESDASQPFQCTTCGHGFSNKKYLHDHIKGAHSGKNYVCVKCQKAYSWRSAYSYHIKRCYATTPVNH